MTYMTYINYDINDLFYINKYMFKLIMLNYVILPTVFGIDWELVVDDLNTATFGTGAWQFRD